MTEENKQMGENENVQDATERTQDAAAQSGDQSANNAPNAEDFRNMRGIIKDMKGQLNSVMSENAQLKAHIEAFNRPKPRDPFEGRDKTDYVTIEEQQRREEAIFDTLQKEKASVLQETQLIAFLTSHPDYEEVMEKYGKQLPLKARNLLASNPHDPRAMEAAYELCKNSAAYYKDTLSTHEHENVKRAAENMNKPGAGSSAGSGGTVSLINKLKNMTREERLEWSDKCIRGGGR